MLRCRQLFALVCLSAIAPAQSIPLGEIIGDDRSIRDSLYNVTARFPVGWSVRGVTRWGDRETTIYFAPPSGSTIPTLYYRVYSSTMPLPADAEAYLREEARRKEEARIAGGLADYANVVDGFEFKTVNGNPASSHTARFTGGSGTLVEYFVRVLGANGTALFFMRAPVEEFETLRAALDSMVETLRLP